MPHSSSPAQASTSPDIDAVATQQALEWLVTFWSGEVTARERQAFADWQAANPEHQRAWQKVQVMSGRLQEMPLDIGGTTLRAAAAVRGGRRKVLRALGLLIGTGMMVQVARHTESGARYLADYRTGTGERRTLTLEDGTQLSLNAGSAVDIHYDTQMRRILLRSGEILVISAPDPAPSHRALVVETLQGYVRALGTRFMVSREETLSRVAVFEGTVEIVPQQALVPAGRLDAGERASFSTNGMSAIDRADPVVAAWVEGKLVADRMRLADFLAVVERHRSGVLRCDPAIADLIVSGVYPLDDTDRILDSLRHALPVRLLFRTRYWVTVQGRY